MKGNVIPDARQVHGLTQTALARLLNTTQLTVCKWETNTQKPKPETEKRLKKVLGISETDIIEIETLLRAEQHRQIWERLRMQSQL